METRLDKIVDEFAEVFWRMNWKWNTASFKGVPGKDEIQKSIMDAITRLKKQGYDSYTSSGRIMVAKKLMTDEDGACWDWYISLDSKFIDEDGIDEILESFNGNVRVNKKGVSERKMDEISKEVNEVYIPLNVEDGCFYYFKGHNLDEEKINHFLKEECDDQFEKLRFKETWAHYCIGTFDGEKQRWMLPDKKYKGVRGGFKITEVELIVT